MKTLFLGSYGFGNLGDELCLIEAIKAFPSNEVHAFSVDPEYTARCVPGIHGFIRRRAEIADLKPERVVLGGGGVGFFPSIRDSLHWMDDAFRIGAQCHIHNIGVARMDDLSWVKVAEVQRVLKGMSSCTVRDDMSWYAINLWPAQMPGIGMTKYPERLLLMDASLLGLLPKGRPLLGISVTGQALMRQALQQNVDLVARSLRALNGYAIVPIISTVSMTDAEEDDVAGFEVFRRLFLNGFDIVCPEFLDKQWRRDNLTPLRLKGLISGLDILYTQRKHNLIHAIDTATQVVGIYPTIDDSIARIFYSLRDVIPFGSSQMALLTSPGPTGAS